MNGREKKIVSGRVEVLGWATACVREGGISHLLVQSARKLASHFLEFGSLHFFVHDLGSKLPRIPVMVDLCIRQAFPADLPLLLERFDAGQSPEILEERFHRGDLCFIAIAADGKLAHSRWIAIDCAVEVPELGRKLILGRYDGYTYDAYTMPEFRRRGVNAAVRWFSYRQLLDFGVQRIFSYVRGDQPPRVKVAQGCHVPIGTVRYLRLGRRECWSWGRLLPGCPPLRRASVGSDREKVHSSPHA